MAQPPKPLAREHQHTPEPLPLPPRVAKEIIDNQGFAAANEADFAHQGILESPKEDTKPKSSKLVDFKKVILDIDSGIH